MPSDLLKRRHNLTAADPENRRHPLAQSGVGSGHHRSLGNLRHAQQYFLDFEGADVLATPDDQVGGAIGDGQVAVLVEHADVTGAIPTLLVEACRGQRVIGVAQAQVRPLLKISPSGPSRISTPRPNIAVGEQALVLGRPRHRTR